MSEQSNHSIHQTHAPDLLEKEYHEIGIHAIQAATCVKKPKAVKKSAVQNFLSEDPMTD